MYHRDLYLEQETKYGYQNRYNNGDPLARASCILHLEERPGLDTWSLARGSRDITDHGGRQLATPPHIVHQTVCVWWVGPPCPSAGQPLRSVLWNTFLASAAVRILFVAYIGRRERAAVRQGMSLGPAGQQQVELSINSGRD